MIAARQIVNLALIGFMGTGKSSVGRCVAEQLHFDFLDTDELIETRAGKTITELFAQNGEPAFRELEHQLVEQLALRHRTVISTGGGLPVQPDNLESLKRHALVVCLWASPEKIFERVREQATVPCSTTPIRSKKSETCSRRGNHSTNRPTCCEHRIPLRPRSRPASHPPFPSGGRQSRMKADIRQRARELGFDDCRFTTAAPPPSTGHFQAWLGEQQHGEMAWLERNADKRWIRS